jgi:predicted N-acetyltransferase YhbS
MITIRNERASDAKAREALLDIAYGPIRFSRPSQRLREDRQPVEGLSLVAIDGEPGSKGRMVGTLRLWDINAGTAGGALLLGPLAVDPDYRNRGIGALLMQRGLAAAALRGHAAVLLVGDAPYYGRFGFSAEKTGSLRMTGQYERQRLLGLELKPGALDGAHGRIAATGERKRAFRPQLPRRERLRVSYAA